MLRIVLLHFIFFYSVFAYGLGNKTLTLSLHEAICLAVRENPSVQQAELNHVLQKFALEVAAWQFQPHYGLTASMGRSRGVISGNGATAQNWGIQPVVSLNTPVGTQLTLASTNNSSHQFNPGLSFQVIQPLMRGFGRPVVEAALCNAMDSERISRLNIENALRTTVTAVINAYLNVVSAENTITIDKEALKRAEISVDQTRLFIKAGRKAGVELVTVQADVANAQTKLENDKNTADQMRYALLTAIGIDPNTNMVFSNINIPQLIKKYSVLDLETTKKLTLQNDIQYQVDQIMLYGPTRRNVLVAEDNTRWQLNFVANVGTGAGNGGGPNAGFRSLINGFNQTQGVQLNLTVPIDDRNAKQALLSAKISLREAMIALRQEKWSKETNAINTWNTINSISRAVQFAESAEQLQQKTYEISFKKYTFGLIDSVELQSVQQQLILRQQSLLDARINYLKALVNSDQQVGKTLKTWGIVVRCS